jgi:hypothetical protein
MADVALIQEPWIYRGKIRGLTNSGGTIFSVAPEGNARSCIYTRHQINALLLLELCSTDLTAVRMTYTCAGSWEELIIASAHLPYDSDEPPPTKELRDVIDYCGSRKKLLIIGSDPNAHHILWGSTDTNPRGESFMEYLVSSNLNILNQGNEPTFVIRNRKEVTDLTLGTTRIENVVSNWHVSDEPSFSDHRHICFQIGNIDITRVTFRDPKRTNWESYKDNLKVNLGTMTRKIRMIRDIDLAADQLQRAIILSYHNKCQAKTTRSPRTVPSWNKTLSELRAQTRKLFNVARTGQWDTYKEALICYKKEIRKAKRSSWRRYCQEIADVPGSARLMKIMAKQATNRVSTIKPPDGQCTQTGKETLEELFRVHFPESVLIDDSTDGQEQQNLDVCRRRTNRGDWNLAKIVINQSKIRWALNTFKPFKSAGTDEIVPAFLQQGVEHLSPHLCCIFRACLAYGYIPMAWRQVRVTLYLSPGNLIILRLKRTVLSAYRLFF